MGENRREVLEAAIPPALWRVLRCIHDLGSANAVEVSGQLQSQYGIECHPKTVGVFLLRLVERGLITAEPATAAGRGRPLHVYTAAVSKEAALRGQFEAFLDTYLIRGDELGVLAQVLKARISQREGNSMPNHV
jgi:predicted transcriptional regulator